MERSTSFTGDYYNQLEVLEIPNDLTSPPMDVDEESKSQISQTSEDTATAF
jgi:hypothetical protein